MESLNRFINEFWWLIAILVFIAVVNQTLNVKGKRKLSGKYRPGEPLPFVLNTSILTNAELNYYKALKKVIGDQATICPKVRLADFLQIPAFTNNQMKYLNMISGKHVDFLICETTTMSPIFVIELDDSSHNKPKNKESDIFKNNAFNKANIEIIRVRVASTYNIEKMANDLRPRLMNSQRQDVSNK